ncbi:MAG: guanylate kinase [Candidatus Moraniibacteriota bacterium]
MKNIFIISGPSGSGQDSIIEGLQKKIPIELVMTSTTRQKRDGESEGNPYHFISLELFEKNIKEGKFLEYAKTYNEQYYGVTYEEIKRVAESRKFGVWKMDWRGVETAKKIFPTIIAFLVTAPLDILESRIRRRDNPKEAFIQERMEYTKEFLNHTHLYDYVIKNEEGKLEQAIEQVFQIITKCSEQS